MIFITIVVLILTVGIKLLLNTSLFVARFNDNNSGEPLKKSQHLISDVDIFTIPIATNSANIFVAGSVVNFEIVEFYLNGDLVKETPLLISDNFNEEIGTLKNGGNEVFVIGKTKDESDEKKSKVYNVLYKNEKPKLEISEPENTSISNIQDIKVAGSTDKDTYIRINELPVVVDAQGFFQSFIKLNEGENKITVTAQDIAENLESKTLTVTYEKE